jgi:CarD family transcriptional regulator
MHRKLKGGSAMQFSVGDKVVHPQYGPGQITGIVCRELVDGAKCYYVIDMPGQGLTLHVPVLRAGELGMRPAMPLSMLLQVLSTLRSSPCRLPDDPRERQGQIGANIRTGEVLPLASVVRDLTWHRERAHLTKRDSDLLKQGQARLAAEMALVSGDNASDSIKLIGSTMTAALASAAG